MALVVFLKGVNVGGQRTFRPSIFVKKLAAFGVVNVGAAGTFVVREKISQTMLRGELVKRLPFKAEIIICPALEITKLVRQDPFHDSPVDSQDLHRFVSVMPKPPRTLVALPFDQSPGDKWEVRIIRIVGRFALSLWQRRTQGILYPNTVVEKQLATTATTRSWNTIIDMNAILTNRNDA